LQNFTLITTTVAELYTYNNCCRTLYTYNNCCRTLYAYNNCCRTLHL